MKFVLSSAFQPPAHVIPIALAAEEAGYEAISFSDHVVYPEKLDTPYPYSKNGERRYQETSEFPDPWIMSGALGMLTERIRFTTQIYVLPMRNPFMAAKQIATAAALTRDRITLTVGVGWSNLEFQLLGQDFKRRGARADEMIEVMKQCWTGEWVEHQGEFYSFDRLKLMPPIPEKPIPIWVGGISDFALRRAARNDGWLSDLQTSAEIIECVDKLRRFRRDLGKSEDCDVMASPRDVNDVDGYSRLADAGVNHIIAIPWLFYHGMTNDLDKKIDGTKRFAEEVLNEMR